MTWLAQVRHVAAKDLRQMRWLVATYGLILLVATARSLSWRGTGSDIFQTASILVVCFGMLLVAVIVQADSPTRSDAFWATRPFYPSAVLAAKCCLTVVFVIGLGLIGQTFGLHVRGVTARQMPILLGQSAWAYALWLLLAMVAAALAKDLPSGVITLIVVAVVLVAIGLMFPGSEPGPAGVAVRAILLVVGVAGGVALLAVLYKTRDTRRRTWFAGLVTLACLFATIFISPAPGRPVDAPPSVPRATLDIELRDYDKLAVLPRIELVIHTTSSPSLQGLTLRNAVAVVRLRDGSTLRLPVLTPLIGLGPIGSPAFDNITWPRESPQARSTTEIPVPLDDVQQAAVARGVRSVALEGSVWVNEAHVAATLPLSAGASVAREAAYVRIVRWSHGFGEISLTIERSAVQTPAVFVTGTDASVELAEAGTSRLANWIPGPQFALLNPVRRQAVALTAHSFHGLNASLVLPGPDLASEVDDVTTSSGRDAHNFTVDDDWLRSARLMIIDWIPRGSYPVHAEFVVPTSPPPSNN
jgi:hypothetical protein